MGRRRALSATPLPFTASADFAYPVWCDLRNGGNGEVYIAGPLTLSPGVPRMMNP